MLFVLNERFISVGRGVNVRGGISAERNPIPLDRESRRLRAGPAPVAGPSTARRQSHYSYKRKIRDAADSSPRSPARCVLLYIPTLICKATKTCTTFCLLFPLPNNSRYSPLIVSGHPHASYNTPSKRSFSRWSLTALCTVISDRKSH